MSNYNQQVSDSIQKTQDKLRGQNAGHNQYCNELSRQMDNRWEKSQDKFKTFFLNLQYKV